MKYVFFVSCLFLTSFSYTMDDNSGTLKKSPYMDRFYRDSSSGKLTVFCKTRQNESVGIITRDQGSPARIIFDVNTVFFGSSPDDERLSNIVCDEISVRLQSTLTGLEESYKN
jgi:hypothetical protein